ncbi:anti-sigma factor family protein [Occallatibacter savannae]|uniref:anti-sigma factor family protein n=1 Tax=Occallatibacter savannae TaxID=1002691 RepID=UPI000D69004A|nr:zf-HC2 domain-containing protein [Occallatibacter savannae]
MNCELAHERIVLAAYGELPDEQVHELDRHLAACNDCNQEREQLRALKTLAAAYPVTELDPNLVARSRMRLEEALDAVPPKRWYERVGQRILNNFASLQAAPVAALLLLIVGGGAGTLGGYEYAAARAAHNGGRVIEAPVKAEIQPVESAPAEIANISSIEREPNSEIVHVTYNTVIPQHIQGSLDDPSIRQLLMLASENATSAGVRDDSVGLLAAECRAGHGCQGEGIRDALMQALRYDKSVAVREKALEGLQPYVAEDMRVRDAVLEALLNDSDPRIRTDAISILEPVEADTSVRQVLSTVANSDHNPHIRTVSRQVLSRAPVIQ